MLKYYKLIFGVVVMTMILNGCKQKAPLKENFTPTAISSIYTEMMDLMIHDVTNPPLASRFFAYTTLAGYEVISQNEKGFKRMHGVLNEYPDLKKTDSIQGYAYQLSALLAMLETAKKMQPSGKLLEKYRLHLLDSCRQSGYTEDMIAQSEKYALAVSKKILAYAKSDRYNKISNYQRYTPSNVPGSWYPTPPAFFEAVEPWFKTVRPFALDTCNQFIPLPPVAFSTDKNSAFFKMMLTNYNDTLTEEHRSIAAFWDCNPFALQDKGHLLMGVKKISPGAHWMGITGIACVKAEKSFGESMLIFSNVAVGLMDGFICCWDEKYRSNRIRPETAIRKYIDTKWEPLLQTPPFPEYLSGHSTISATSATILTHYFGDKFNYTDSVEVRYGLPARNFTSFLQAAQEAAISRFYGGIHFKDAIDNGLLQGYKVGDWVVNKVSKTKKIRD